MRRWIEPSIWVFALALLGSVALHLPAYGVLGALADRLLDDEDEQAMAPAEVEFTVGEPAETEEDEAEPADDGGGELSGEEPPEEMEADRAEEPPEQRRPEPEPEPQREQKKKQKKKDDEKKDKEEAELQPRPAQANRHAVTQHSNEETPDEARFVSDRANRVEEQTVARQRNLVRDDENPQPGPQQEPTESEQPGNADESLSAEMREMQGSDIRRATPEESREQRPEQASETPPPPKPPKGNDRPQGDRASEPGRQERAGGEARPEVHAERAGGEQAEQAPDEGMVVVEDGFGTLRIPRAGDPRPEGEGQGEDNVRGQRAREASPGERARRGRRGDGRSIPGVGPNRRFAWSRLQELYGRERLEEEREQYVEERLSQQEGQGNHRKRWKKFRAAIENYVPNVRPGNQTALNAAASPFADYIAKVHRRLHPQFSGKFLAGLPTYSSSPYSDRSLKTKLEIILNKDGTVHRVGIVNTSGFLPFDYGAWRSVMKGQPYPQAPTRILSGDGKVYLHWGFYRNERQCGTFNAEPFILPQPPGTPEPGSGGPLQDEPEWGGVVPGDAQPTWGVDEDDGGEGKGGEGDDAPSPEREPGGQGGDDGKPSDEQPERREPRAPPRRGERGAAMG